MDPERFREFWRTASWMREQSESWAARHYPAETRDVAARVMFCLMEELAEDADTYLRERLLRRYRCA